MENTANIKVLVHETDGMKVYAGEEEIKGVREIRLSQAPGELCRLDLFLDTMEFLVGAGSGIPVETKEADPKRIYEEKKIAHIKELKEQLALSAVSDSDLVKTLDDAIEVIRKRDYTNTTVLKDLLRHANRIREKLFAEMEGSKQASVENMDEEVTQAGQSISAGGGED